MSTFAHIMTFGIPKGPDDFNIFFDAFEESLILSPADNNYYSTSTGKFRGRHCSE